MFDFLEVIPLIGGPLATIVPFIIVLGIVVFIHEYGHYIVGRWCGIHAETFSMGFGPVLTHWHDKRGTQWQVSALPLGGYVKFLGDQNNASAGADADVMQALSPADLERSFHGAKLWKRALTVFAGPAANFILSLVIFAGLTLSTGVATNDPIVGEIKSFPGVVNQLQTGDKILKVNGVDVASLDEIAEKSRDMEPTPVTLYVIERDGEVLTVQGPFPWLPIVAGVNPVTPAAKAGILAGDLILRVGDTDIASFPQLQQIIRAAPETDVPLLIQRGDQRLELIITPRLSPYEKEDGSFGERVQIGIGGALAFGPTIEAVGPLEALYYGSLRVGLIVEGFGRTIYHLFTGGLALKNLQGPLGIAVASGDSAAQGLLDFIFLVAFISTAIGLMNLLPIPVLDGGHLLIFAYQAVFRREPNERVLQVAMTMGLSLLLMLMVYATFNDVLRL